MPDLQKPRKLRTLPQFLYRQRRAKRFRSGGLENDGSGQPAALSFEVKAMLVISTVAAALTPVCWNAGSIAYKPQRVEFTVRERMDSEVMHNALVRLVNAGTLEPIYAHCRLPLATPTFAAYRSPLAGIRVEFRTLEANAETLKS